MDNAQKLAILPMWVIDRIKEEMRLSPAGWQTIMAAVEQAEVPQSLPCEVKLPPGTVIGKGVPVSTLMLAIAQRERYPVHARAFAEQPQGEPRAPTEREAWALQEEKRLGIERLPVEPSVPVGDGITDDTDAIARASGIVVVEQGALTDDEIVDAMREHLNDADGGYVVDLGRDYVVKAGRALLSYARRSGQVETDNIALSYLRELAEEAHANGNDWEKWTKPRLDRIRIALELKPSALVAQLQADLTERDQRIDQLEQQPRVPDGFALVPQSMLLSKEVIGVINFHCGDTDQEEGGQFGQYTDGRLWVGHVLDDDGRKVHGLHIATDEYPEEGSTTLIEFPKPGAEQKPKECGACGGCTDGCQVDKDSPKAASVGAQVAALMESRGES